MISIVVVILFVVLGIAALAMLSNKQTPFAIGLFLTAVIGSIGGLVSYPYVNVWQQELEGRAELARAEQNRQIVINEARARNEAAKYWAEAEIARAKGVAEANRIIADGLGGPEGYLRYLYIEGLKEAEAAGASVIYIPTEAGLPILEAGKRPDR